MRTDLPASIARWAIGDTWVFVYANGTDQLGNPTPGLFGAQLDGKGAVRRLTMPSVSGPDAGPQTSIDIAVSAGNLFVTVDGKLFRSPIPPSDPPAYEELTTAYDIVGTTKTHLFVSTGSALTRVDGASGATDGPLDSSTSVNHVAFTATQAYWRQSGTVFSTPIAGGAVTSTGVVVNNTMLNTFGATDESAYYVTLNGSIARKAFANPSQEVAVRLGGNANLQYGQFAWGDDNFVYFALPAGSGTCAQLARYDLRKDNGVDQIIGPIGYGSAVSQNLVPHDDWIYFPGAATAAGSELRRIAKPK